MSRNYVNENLWHSLCVYSISNLLAEWPGFNFLSDVHRSRLSSIAQAENINGTAKFPLENTNNKVSCRQTQHSSSWNCLLCLYKTWKFTSHFLKKQVYDNVSAKVKGRQRNLSTLRWQNKEGGEHEETNKTNLSLHCRTPSLETQARHWGNCYHFIWRTRRALDGAKTAAEIIKSALIIPVFSKPHGKDSSKCHCRKVHFELYVSVCLWIILLVWIPPQFAS